MASRVLDLTRSAPRLKVEVQAGTAFELLISISAFESRELKEAPDVEAGWLEKAAERVSKGLRESLERLGWREAKHWGALVGFAAHPPVTAEADAFLARVKATEPLELRLIMLGARFPDLTEEQRDAVLRAAGGDHTAFDDVLELERRHGMEEEAALRALLSLSVEETKSLLIRVLRRWREEVLRPDEDVIAQILLRDADAKRALLGTLPPERLIEQATNGLEFSRPSWTNRVVLIPHLAMRPWNILCEHEDSSVICYPAADQSFGADRTAPPPQLVRFHKAVGDHKRLRMLRRLAQGDATLQELADVAGLAKSSAHHHLVILRSAGLLRVTTDEHARYSLRREAVEEMAGWLETFLGREAVE